MNSSSTLKQQPAKLYKSFNHWNNTTENHTNEDPDNTVKFRCYEIEEIETWKIPNKSKFLSMFHMHAEF